MINKRTYEVKETPGNRLKKNTLKKLTVRFVFQMLKYVFQYFSTNMLMKVKDKQTLSLFPGFRFLVLSAKT